MLAFPYGTDQTVFAVGGKMVLKHGAIPTIDFLDTKPPVIFYIYAFSQFLFGGTPVSIRIFDVLYTLLTCYVGYRFLKKVFPDNKLIPFVSSIVYILYYATGSYWRTAQVESFSNLFFILTAFTIWQIYEAGDRQVRRDLGRIFLMAVYTLVLFFMKYSFIIVIVPTMILLVYSGQDNHLGLRRSMTFLLILTALGGIVTGIFSAVGWLDDYRNMFVWLNEYSRFKNDLSLIENYRLLLMRFPETVIGTLTPVYLVLLVVGIGIAWKNILTVIRKQTTSIGFFYWILLVNIFFGLIGVLAERKLFYYHYVRILWFIAPFICIALLQIWESIREHRSDYVRSSVLSKIFLVSIIGSILFFSPVLRVFTQSVQWTALRIAGNEKGIQARLALDAYNIGDFNDVIDTLQQTLQPEDEIFVFGNMPEIYDKLDRLPTTKCLVITPFNHRIPDNPWRREVIEQLHRDPPRFIIAVTKDENTDPDGNIVDSYHIMKTWADFDKMVAEKYIVVDTFSHSILYERI
jgi:hypothetical protein